MCFRIAKIDSGKFFVGGHKNECITLGRQSVFYPILHRADIARSEYGLSEILREHLAKLDNFKMHFSSPVTAIDQDEESITVSSNDKRYRAKYMVGCDGGRSGCRKLLGIKAEGYTMPYPVVANNVYYDFMKHGFGNGEQTLPSEKVRLIKHQDNISSTRTISHSLLAWTIKVSGVCPTARKKECQKKKCATRNE